MSDLLSGLSPLEIALCHSASIHVGGLNRLALVLQLLYPLVQPGTKHLLVTLLRGMMITSSTMNNKTNYSKNKTNR